MLKKRSKLWWSLATVAILGLVTLMLLPTQPGVSRLNVYRVKLGMTKTETQAILGDPDNGIVPDGRTWWPFMLA